MPDYDKNAVRDMRQAFDLTGASSALAARGFPCKIFKSGNSLALRLPKALGLEAGMELTITPDGLGNYALTRAEPPRRKIDISGFAGKLPGFKPAPREDFEERPSTIAAREAARKAALGE
jgi:antitoxin VapB